MELTKKSAKQLKGDYIPGGKSVDISKLSFRRTRENEVYRCCFSTGYDPQSGPLYCGDIAEFIADVVEGGVKTGLVALCGRGRHKPSTTKEEK